MLKARPTIASPSRTPRRPRAAIGITAWIKPATVAAGIWGRKARSWRQAWSPKPQPAPNLRPKPAAHAKETATSATPAQPVTRDTDPAATFSMLSAALPTLASAVDGEPAIASNDAAGELVAMHPGDDMPVIWPRPHRGRPSGNPEQPARNTVNLEAYMLCLCRGRAQALVVIVYKVFRSPLVRPPRSPWRLPRAMEPRTLPATPLREPVVFADTVAAASQTQPGRKLVAVPPTAKIALAPADDPDPITTSTVKACGSSYMACGAWRHEHARLVVPWPLTGTSSTHYPREHVLLQVVVHPRFSPSVLTPR